LVLLVMLSSKPNRPRRTILCPYTTLFRSVTPEPSDMPGYDDPVIMAGGTFIQGSSIELSADGPIRPPYVAYVQGGLTYAHVKGADRKSTRLNSSHVKISYDVFCLNTKMTI